MAHPTQSGGVSTRKVKVRRKPAPTTRGPQGLPTASGGTPRRPAPRPAAPRPLIQQVTKTVTTQPKIRRKVHRAVKQQQANLRVSGDRPTPGGRTHGIDATKSPEYRATIKTLLARERNRLGVGDGPNSTKFIPHSTPTSHLGAELQLLRNVDRKHTQNLTHPLGKDEYHDRRTGAKVDVPGIVQANTLHDSKIEGGADAAVTKALDQTVRPLHALAAGADAAVAGKNVAHAAGRGFANKDKATFGRVLKHLGAPKGVQAVLGTTLDIGLDPTTYVTGGEGSIARREAEKQAERIAKIEQAAKDTVTPRTVTDKEARRAAARSQGGGADMPSLAERARARRLATGDQRHGVTVRVAGREVPGVRAATARVIPKRVKARLADSAPARAVKHVAADLNPDASPAGMTKAETREVNRATRTARATPHRGAHAAQQRAIAIKRQIGPDNYQRVIDAIEADNVRSLPPELTRAAVEVRSLFKGADRRARRGGIKTGKVTSRAKVRIPEVTARPAEATAREVDKAQRSVNAAQRRLQSTLEARGVAQGRAEILSRQVAGTGGERAAENASKVKARLDRAEQHIRTGDPRDVLRYIDQVDVASTRYAGGATGVNQARAAHDIAKAEYDTARKRLADAQAEHESQKALTSTQRQAQRDAIRERDRQQISAKGYVPHVRAEVADESTRSYGRKATAETRKVTSRSTKARGDVRPLAEIRKEEPGLYSEDLPRLVADRMSEAARVEAKAELHRRLAESGRPVPRDGSELALKPGEAVYHVKGSTISEVTDQDALDKVTTGSRPSTTSDKIRPSYQANHGGRFVILNKQAVDRALEGAAPQMTGHGIIRGLDKVQGGFKGLATVPNPGFHVRNFIGDTQNAYLAESAPRLARNMGQAGRALKHLGKQEQALRDLDKRVDPSNAGLKINGKHVAYADLVKEAERTGAIRSGFIARELPELAQKDITKGRDRLHRISRQVQNREDVVRLATYIGGRKRGLSPERAAERAAKYHFDYGHLTHFERNVARRVMPFYTFSARNIPLQARSFVTHPGKFANYEKIREEAANAAGLNDPQPQQVHDLYTKLKQAGVQLPDGWEKYLSTYEQRNAGIPIKSGKSVYTVSAGLPLTDIAEIPGIAGKHQLDEWFQRAMGLTTPVLKDPVELADNYSLFFRGPIESDASPLVQAPGIAGSAAFKPFRKKLGIVRGTDKRTGKQVWMWPGKVDYIAHAVPGPTTAAQQIATARARGSSAGNKLLAYSGIKATKVDPLKAVVGLAYGRITEIQKQQAALRQQRRNGLPINATNPTREYQRLTDQLHLAQEIAYQAKSYEGYKVLPKSGGPKKSRGGGNFDFTNSGQNFDFSGAGGSSSGGSSGGNFDFGS